MIILSSKLGLVSQIAAPVGNTVVVFLYYPVHGSQFTIIFPLILTIYFFCFPSFSDCFRFSFFFFLFSFSFSFALKMASINIRFAICPILSPPVQNIKAISPISSAKQKALFVLYPSTATIRAHSKQGTRPSAMPITERTT